MKKLLIIIVLVIVAIAIYQILQPKLQECPDAISGNLMPGGGSGRGAYYVKNGEARKVSDYDGEWVRANCRGKIEDKTVN